MEKIQELYSWEQISKAEGGTIFLDRIEDGIRMIIMKGGSSLCCYLGIPDEHPLAGFAYDDMPIDCHGGLTFSEAGGGRDMQGIIRWPKGYWWYGWDYAHSGDYCDYYDKYLNDRPRLGKKWLVNEVVEDGWEARYQLKKLMDIAEKIKIKYDKKG